MQRILIAFPDNIYDATYQSFTCDLMTEIGYDYQTSIQVMLSNLGYNKKHRRTRLGRYNLSMCHKIYITTLTMVSYSCRQKCVIKYISRH